MAKTLWYNFTNLYSGNEVFKQVLNGAELKKLIGTGSTTGVVSFSTSSGTAPNLSSACKLNKILFSGTFQLAKAGSRYTNQAGEVYITPYFSTSYKGDTKSSRIDLPGSIFDGGPAVDEYRSSQMSYEWTSPANLINTSIFGVSGTTFYSEITLKNLNSLAELNFKLKGSIGFEYTPASYIYFRNDGSILNSSNTYYSEGSVPSYSGTLTKTGYTFGGWKSSRTGTIYGPGETLPAADDYDTIYDAEWNENTYTIKFNANGAAGSMADKVLKYKESYIIPSENFTHPPLNTVYYNSNGATEPGSSTVTILKQFSGYWIDEKGNILTAGNTVSKLRTGSIGDDVITLYAQWNDKGVLLETPKRQYHIFTGWKDINNPDIIYNGGDYLILTDRDVYLEAQWKKVEPRIFFKETNNSTGLQRVPTVFAKSKKIQKIFLYTLENGLQEI